MLHSVLSPSRAIKTRLRLNHWSLLAVIVCACLLIFASTVVNEDQVAHTGVSSFQLFLTSAVAILAVATTMKLRKDPTREPPPRALVIAAAAFILLLVLAVVSLPLAKHWVSAQYRNLRDRVWRIIESCAERCVVVVATHDPQAPIRDDDPAVTLPED